MQQTPEQSYRTSFSEVVLCSGTLKNLVNESRALKKFCADLQEVYIAERSTAYTNAPFFNLKPSETVCLIFILPMPLSDPLSSEGTSLRYKNGRIESGIL